MKSRNKVIRYQNSLVLTEEDEVIKKRLKKEGFSIRRTWKEGANILLSKIYKSN